MAGASADFRALVDRHGAGVLRLCRSIVREEALSLDAAQETFVRLWRHLAAAGGAEANASWIRRAAVSASIDLLRTHQAARHGTPASELEEHDPPAAAQRSPAAELADAELRRAFDAALAELPEGQRVVFQMRHEGGLTLGEIAESLDLAPTTVRTQFARAVLRLQSRLQRFHPGDLPS